MKKLKAVSLLLIMIIMISSTVLANTKFSDIQNHWGKATIEWGISQGMVEGYPDGTFKPNKQVTEAEFLALLIRAYKSLDEVDNPQHWADRYYEFAKHMNYPVNGLSDINKRNYVVTRGHVAEIVAGTQGVNYSGKDAIHYLLAYGLAKGQDPNKVTIDSFGAENTLTRAESVQFIKNLKEKGKATIQQRPVEPSNPNILPPLPDEIEQGLPEDEAQSKDEFPITYPYAKGFVESLNYENGVLTGTIPNIPNGYRLSVRYTDLSDGRWGNREYDRYLTQEEGLKPGDSFTITVHGQGGYIILSYINLKTGIIESGVRANVPSMEVFWTE